MIDLKKFEAANEVLTLMEKDIWFTIDKGYLQINWRHWKTKATVTKRWMCDSNFYPPYRLPTGGTYTKAIANLAAWIRGGLCYPLITWKYWVGDQVGMKPANIIEILEANGYPTETNCGFCGKELKSWDWWHSVGIGCRIGTDCEHHKQRSAIA